MFLIYKINNKTNTLTPVGYTDNKEYAIKLVGLLNNIHTHKEIIFELFKNNFKKEVPYFINIKDVVEIITKNIDIFTVLYNDAFYNKNYTSHDYDICLHKLYWYYMNLNYAKSIYDCITKKLKKEYFNAYAFMKVPMITENDIKKGLIT